MLGHQLLQAFVGHMGVDLGGADVGVAEQHLYHAQVGAVVDQMGGKSMAQAVRAEWRMAAVSAWRLTIIHASWREMAPFFWLTNTASQARPLSSRGRASAR